MDLPRAAAFAGRFAAGFAALLCLAGLLWRILPDDFPSPAGCLAAGALAAGVFAFVRGGQPMQAVTLSAGAVSFHLAATWHQGPARALPEAGAHLIEAGGIATAAVVFHLLAERGARFGKFLITGPMLSLAFAAAAPASQVGAAAGDEPLRPLFLGGLFGLIVGQAVGIGVEAGELGAHLLQARQAPRGDVR